MQKTLIIVIVLPRTIINIILSFIKTFAFVMYLMGPGFKLAKMGNRDFNPYIIHSVSYNY
jgi:hypothetical protein